MAGKEPTQAITHFGIDTSALIEAGWPRVSADFDSILATCKALNIPILVPKCVLIEANAVWNRETEAALRKFKESSQMLTRRLEPGFDASKVKVPGSADVTALYDSAVDQFVKAYGVEILPLPNLSLEEAVHQSAQYRPPFREADRDFRDSVIAYSILDAVKKGAVVGLLVKDGKYFPDDVVRRAFAARGVTLRLFMNRREALADVERLARLTDLAKLFEEVGKKEKELLPILQDRRAEVEEYIRRTIRIPKMPLGVAAYLRAVQDVSVLEIRSVHISPLSKTPRPSADITVRVRAIATTMSPPSPPELPVGEQLVLEGAAGYLLGPTEIEFDGSVTLTFEIGAATTSGEPSIEYGEVSFDTPAFRALKAQALLKALGVDRAGGEMKKN